MKKGLKIVLVTVGAIVAICLINFAPMVSLKTPGMRRLVLEGVGVYAVEKDDADAALIAARIVGARAAIEASLGVASGEAVEVIVYPTQKALHRKTLGFAGMLLPEWFIGDNTRRYVLITSPGDPGPQHSRESVVQAAVHEYVHVMTDRRNRELGYWLKEGIALYLAGQTPDPDFLNGYIDLSWEEYANPNAIQFSEVGGYYLAYTLIDYVEQRFGWKAVVELTMPGADFEAVLGSSERGIFDSWLEWLRGEVTA